MVEWLRTRNKNVPNEGSMASKMHPREGQRGDEEDARCARETTQGRSAVGGRKKL